MQRYIFLQVHLQQHAGKPQNNYTKANWNNLLRECPQKLLATLCNKCQCAVSRWHLKPWLINVIRLILLMQSMCTASLWQKCTGLWRLVGHCVWLLVNKIHCMAKCGQKKHLIKQQWNMTVQSVSTNVVFGCVFTILPILLEGTVVVISHHMSRVISLSLHGNCYLDKFSSIIFTRRHNHL